jgi:preprotein translocase subunit SecG
MSFIAGVLTVVLLANCVLLVLLVLIQLPKKDAGAGIAFGGGAADALFGAGSGNALTKITKWAAGVFFVMALVLGALQQAVHRGSSPAFLKAVEQQQSQTPGTLPPAAPVPPATAPAATNSSYTPVTPASNAPATPQPK